jgi:hypothetical protein
MKHRDHLFPQLQPSSPAAVTEEKELEILLPLQCLLWLNLKTNNILHHICYEKWQPLHDLL